MLDTASEMHDAEIVIRRERILKVLDESILKIELALSMPIFLKNLDQYRDYINYEEFSILSKCKAYQILEENSKDKEDESDDANEEIDNGSPIHRKKSMLDTQIHESSNENFEMSYMHPISFEIEDCNIKRAIEIICRPDLRGIVKNEPRTSPASSENPSEIFLIQMHALRDNFQMRLMGDPSYEAEKLKMQFYRDLWRKNEEAVSVIKVLQPTLTNITLRIKEDFSTKDNEIKELLNKIENVKINFKEEVKRICAESEKNMVAESKDSETQLEGIHMDIGLLEEKLQEILKDNLKKEKDLRTKRYKIETQLESILEKYDTDMGSRQAEFEKIKAEYDEEEHQLNILQENFNNQDNEYVALMEEKAEEERMELEQKIEDLRCRVAARVIQTYWRELKRRRLERAKMRKGKKGKGKKKGGKKSPSPKRAESAGSPKKSGPSKNKKK